MIHDCHLSRWPYSIVNTGAPMSPLWYGGFFLGHIVVYFFWTGMSRFKLTLRYKTLSFIILILLFSQFVEYSWSEIRSM